jgi:hypothetical protein
MVTVGSDRGIPADHRLTVVDTCGYSMVLRTSERYDLGVWIRNEGISGAHREGFSTTSRNSHTFFVCEVLEAVV